MQSFPRPLKVVVYADKGPGGVGAIEWCRLVDDSPDMELKLVDGALIQEGVLAGHDVLVMPGGDSLEEFKSLGSAGIDKLREFVRNGGGYIGTCAGCSLLTDGNKRICMMPWRRTGCEPDLFFPRIKVTDEGARALGLKAGRYSIRYHGGPFLWPTTNVIADANFQVWGLIDSEATYEGRVSQTKKMYGAAAILGGTYGRGRVFATSLHPEYFESTYQFVRGAFRYVAGRNVKLVRRQRHRGDLAVGYMPAGLTIQAAHEALEYGKIEGVHLRYVSHDDIFWGVLDHLDVFVSPLGVSPKNRSRKKIETFIARGGTLLSVREDSPKGGFIARTNRELLEELRRLAAAR